MQLEIWHNPRCSKSRATLALIQAAGVRHMVRRYLENPPTLQELDVALRGLGLEPSELVRANESVAKDLGIRDRELSRAEWLRLMVDNPILIERPVVLASDGRAILGRPPEKVRELF